MSIDKQSHPQQDTDYESLDISAWCNVSPAIYERQTPSPAGSDLYVTRQEIPVGRQTFHGLPFQIGAGNGASEPCFIGLGTDKALYQDSITVAVQKSAWYVLFAHALLETDLWQGRPVGTVVARYVFHYEDGQSIEVPIRERFEVGNFPFAWGQKPFLCVSDRKNHLLDRRQGDWEMTGWRHTEVKWGQPQGYYIWPWANPRPEYTIKTIELVPGRYTFIVAAITLSHVDEFPLVRSTRRPVKITIPQSNNGPDTQALEVEVDRGVATYPYPLPLTPLDKVESGRPGFGAPLNNTNNPCYTEIAAIPSATVSVKQAGVEIGWVRWGALEAEGTVETGQMRLEVIDPGKNWVHVMVVDEDTKQPLPCRVAFHSAEGVPYAPHGHHAPLFSNLDTWNQDIGGDVRLAQITYSYIDGTCQGWLPRGNVLVDVARGYEYEPLRTWVTIEPGQQQLTLSLKRWANMNEEGWFSGDSHVHFLSTIGSQLEARGEGLNVVNVLQSQWGHLFSNTEEFTGRPHVSDDGQTVVYVTQENRHHMFGHLTLLGLKTPVMPWCSGGPSEAELGGGVDTTLSYWADACHAQGGTVIIPHLGITNCESAALIATQRADAVEMLTHAEYLHLEYYRYLNGGYRLPLVGGTDKMDAQVPVGLYRTYVYIPPDEEFSYDTWCQGLRAGRTFLSAGPLLWFTVEGEPIGSTLHIKHSGTVEIEAHARSIFPIHTLQLVQQGQVVAETHEMQGAKTLRLHTRLRVSHDTWLAVRCAGPDYTAIPHHDSWQRGIMAHTSPIYITCGPEYSLIDPATTEYMLTLIDGGLSYIRNLSPQHRADLVTYQHGHAEHGDYLEKPFLEARAALHHRLHALGISH